MGGKDGNDKATVGKKGGIKTPNREEKVQEVNAKGELAYKNVRDLAEIGWKGRRLQRRTKVYERAKPGKKTIYYTRTQARYMGPMEGDKNKNKYTQKESKPHEKMGNSNKVGRIVVNHKQNTPKDQSKEGIKKRKLPHQKSAMQVTKSQPIGMKKAKVKIHKVFVPSSLTEPLMSNRKTVKVGEVVGSCPLGDSEETSEYDPYMDILKLAMEQEELTESGPLIDTTPASTDDYHRTRVARNPATVGGPSEIINVPELNQNPQPNGSVDSVSMLSLKTEMGSEDASIKETKPPIPLPRKCCFMPLRQAMYIHAWIYWVICLWKLLVVEKLDQEIDQGLTSQFVSAECDLAIFAGILLNFAAVLRLPGPALFVIAFHVFVLLAHVASWVFIIIYHAKPNLKEEVTCLALHGLSSLVYIMCLITSFSYFWYRLHIPSVVTTRLRVGRMLVPSRISSRLVGSQDTFGSHELEKTLQMIQGRRKRS